MAFLENLSKKVQDVAFVAAEKGKEVAVVVGEKAQDAAEAVKTSMAIAGEQRAIEKNYRTIGEWYFSAMGDDAPVAIADIVKAVRESQAKIIELESQRRAKGDGTVESCCTEVASAPAEACGCAEETQAPAGACGCTEEAQASSEACGEADGTAAQE